MSFNVNPENYKHWHYKNTLLLALSLGLFLLIADAPVVRDFIQQLGNFGYIGAFLAGMLFVSIFTVVPAATLLFTLAEVLDPLGLTIAAAIGSLLGDYIIFRYLKDRIFEELKPIFKQISDTSFFHIFHTPFFSWTIPLLGAAIVISPFPDEAGIGLMRISKLKTWQFLLVTFILDLIGIFLIVYSAR